MLSGLLERRVTLGGRLHEDGPNPELRHYATRSRGRLAGVLDALEETGALRAGERLLEVGASPWLVTQLLAERGVDVVPTGMRDPGDPDEVDLVLEWGDHRADLREHHFDAERERWPFPDGAFGHLLCADIIEHLTFNPGHFLHEANRVLAPGGSLVLSTPNAAAARKTALHLRGRTVHWAYSGHGPTGRHNREYTAPELRELIAAAGFDVRVDVRNIEGYEADEPLGRVLRAAAGALGPLRDRRDHLYALGRKSGPPRMPTPDWLYRSWDRERLRRAGVLLVDE